MPGCDVTHQQLNYVFHHFIFFILSLPGAIFSIYLSSVLSPQILDTVESKRFLHASLQFYLLQLFNSFSNFIFQQVFCFFFLSPSLSFLHQSYSLNSLIFFFFALCFVCFVYKLCGNGVSMSLLYFLFEYGAFFLVCRMCYRRSQSSDITVPKSRRPSEGIKRGRAEGRNVTVKKSSKCLYHGDIHNRN